MRRGRPFRDRAVMLREMYGLTPQQAKVALAIAEGRGLADAAQRLDLSPHTVRNHLQRVFAKTGVNRQAALARLMAKFSG